MRRDDKAAIVGGCFLFADARPESVSALAEAARIVELPARAPVFFAGDPPDGLRVVLSGLVRIWIADADGRELTLALLEAGDPFGEIALLDGLPRTANATVLERASVLFLPGGAVDAALDHDAALARHLIQLLCELLRRNTDAMSAFAFLGLDGRLAQKLHELMLSHGAIEDGRARMRRKFSQSDLARMLGVTREAVNKRLNALAHDGLVSVADGHLVIPDLDALAARASAEARLSARA